MTLGVRRKKATKNDSRPGLYLISGYHIVEGRREQTSQDRVNGEQKDKKKCIGAPVMTEFTWCKTLAGTFGFIKVKGTEV